MKRFALVACLLLAGCGYFDSDDGGVPKEAITIQEGVEIACNFRAEIGPIIEMISAENPAVVGANAIAAAICAAVTTKPTQLFSDDACPKVNGVCIEGEFVEDKRKMKGD